MEAAGATWRSGMAIAALVVALLGGQALADATASSGLSADTGRVIGRTGFAYLTGIRTFAAAVLLERLDPIGDTYYEGTSLVQKKFLIPSLYMVIMLDPRSEQAYFVTPWILQEDGLTNEALGLARRGVADNPRSGMLHTSLALIASRANLWEEAVREADIARTSLWTDADQRYADFVSIEAIYQHVGDHARADSVSKQRLRLPPIRPPKMPASP
jgi:hypothetical protein